MWCPECGSEYVEGIAECADCGCALVDTEPERPEGPSTRDQHFQFGPDEELVEVARIPSDFQAEVIAAHLRDMDIPTAVLGGRDRATAYPVTGNEGSRIFVRVADAERAAAVVNDTYSDTPLQAPFDELELARLAEESAEPEGWVDPDTGAVV